MVTKDIFLPVIGQHFIVIEPDGSPGNSALIPPVPYFHNSIPLPPPYKRSGSLVGLVTAIALHLYELKTFQTTRALPLDKWKMPEKLAHRCSKTFFRPF